MRKITLIVLMLATCLTSFARQSKHKKKKAAANEIVSVSIHRTACFGHCPDYIIEIANTGVATYTGIRFTDDTGIFQKNIGKTQAMNIINQFKANRIDTCKDMYENRIPDLPGLIIAIKYAQKTKTIYNAHFGPSFLKTLGEAIDEAGKKTDNSWKKVGMPKVNY